MESKKEIITLKDGTTIEYTPMFKDMGLEPNPPVIKGWLFPDGKIRESSNIDSKIIKTFKPKKK
jgi:hypothetical protein